MNNYEHSGESQHLYPGCSNSIVARDEVDPSLSNEYYMDPYYNNSLTFEQTPGLQETQFSYPSYNQLSNYTPQVDLKKQILNDVLYSNEIKPAWEEIYKLAFKVKTYLSELFQYEQECTSEFLQRHLDLNNEIIVALTNRVAKIQAKLRSLGKEFLGEQSVMLNKSSPAASLYEINGTINHWLPWASSQISHSCASNELKSEIKPEDSKNYEIKENELQICHSTINEMKSYDEESVDFSTVAPKIINLINKPSEFIQYGMEIFDKIEPNIVFMGSVNFVYKCFWTDLFLNYFDGNLLEQRENYSNYWLDIHVEKIQIKFPGKKSEPEIQDMFTNEKFDLNFLLLCLELFLDKYFVFLLNLSQKIIYDEVKFLFFYSETWKHFLNTTLNISQKYSLEFNQLFNTKSGETSPILSKSLIYWKCAFFQHNELVPEAVWKLIEEEENGGSKTTSSIPDSVVISYKVLGLIEKSKLVDIAQSPQPMDCFEFIDWHMEKFKGKQRKKNQIEYKSEAILKQSKSVCRKPRGRHIKTECGEPSNSESKKKHNYCKNYRQRNREEMKKMQEKLTMESGRNNGLNELFIKYQEEVKKINSTLKDSKSTIVSGNPSTDYSSLLTNIHETEKDLSTKFEQLKSWTNDSSDSSDDDFILLPQPNFSKNPIRLEFEPPSIEWRQERCRELNLAPFEPATIFGPSYVVPWNMPPKRIQKIKGDGNCLFRALVFFLTGHDSDILHVRMRYLICKYMEDHRDDPAILSWVQKYANNVMEYLDAGMRIPGKWGTEVEIQVFARMLNCIVAVWNPGYFANEDQIRWNRYNFYAMEYQPTLFLIFEKSHFNVCLM